MKPRLLATGAMCCALPLASAAAHASCGSAFCTLNTDWEAQGVHAGPGWRLDLRYEYIKQDQLRSGRDKVESADSTLARPTLHHEELDHEEGEHDEGDAEAGHGHDELKTVNRNLVLNLNGSLTPEWGVMFELPLVDREHEHLDHDGLQTWDYRRAGDLRALARWQPDAGRAPYGVFFGLKLPTGSTDVQNENGAVAERSLQPGTGTTDAILGGYYHAPLLIGSLAATGFAQARVQTPFGENDGYKPGTHWGLDAGASVPLAQALSLVAQLNGVVKERDAGANAEPEDSGGSFLWGSVGLQFSLSPGAKLYGVAQLPLYQRVNGEQLTADWAAVVGISLLFGN